jgi:membrane protein implicated in regulation of membrane protease activity
MQPLSPTDGSADAIRDAAEAALSHGDNRLALERELDRLNTAVQGSAAALGQHLSWMLVAQAFLLTAYVIVLIGGWSLPLPGKRWLLTGIAAFALLAVVGTYLGLRAARDRVGPLKAQRQRVEDALERVAARPPAFARQGAVNAAVANASTRGLPLLVVAGWIALSLYSLALPFPTDGKATAGVGAEKQAAAGGAPAARAPRPAAKAGPAPAPESAPAPVADAAQDNPNDPPLLNFLRRAINTPPAAGAADAEPVKP